MADLTPAIILAPPTSAEVMTRLIDGMREVPGFPVRDWEVGGVMRTIVELEKLTISGLLQFGIPNMIAAGHAEFSADAFLNFVSEQLYGIAREGGVSAVQSLMLTCAAGVGPYAITAGTLWFEGLTGNRWFNITGGTLPTNGTLIIQIQAEGPGAKWNDPAGTIKTMLTSLVGVTASNVPNDFSAVVPGANSTGTITPSRTTIGVTPTAATFLVRIDSSGQVGAGGWSYSVDGGRSWRAAGVIAATALLMNDGSGSGTTITFFNGFLNPSFVAGDLFGFATPGTAFLTLGKDQETNEHLIDRCNARWPDLAIVRGTSRYLKWAKIASTTVTRVRLEEDATYPGKLFITLAGRAGAVSAGVVSDVQAYVDPRAPIGRIIVARSASIVQVLGAGTVTVPLARVAAIQAAAQASWQTLITNADIGQVVYASDLVKAVMDAGAIDFQGAQLNGGINVVLASTEVPVINTGTPLLANQLTWVTV